MLQANDDRNYNKYDNGKDLYIYTPNTFINLFYE